MMTEDKTGGGGGQGKEERRQETIMKKYPTPVGWFQVLARRGKG